MTDRKFTHPDDAGPDHPGYVTRDGRPARIICTDFDGEDMVVLVAGRNGECVSIVGVNGVGCGERIFDAPKPKKRGVYERWVNVYPCETVVHYTREIADRNAHSGRIACIHTRQEWEEGEGL